MKQIAIIAFLVFTFLACRNHHRMRTEKMDDNNTVMKIEDDGKTMSMKVKIRNVEKPVSYAENFNVENMSDKQKQKLKNHILDSLYKLNN